MKTQKPNLKIGLVNLAYKKTKNINLYVVEVFAIGNIMAEY